MYRFTFVSILFILLFLGMSANASPLGFNNLDGRELTGAPTCKTNIVITPDRDECSTHCTQIKDIQKRCDDFYPCMCETISPAALDSCLKCTLTSGNDSTSIITAYSNACSFVQIESTMTRAYLPCRSSSNALFGHTLNLSPAEMFRYLIPYMSVGTAAMILIVITDSARKKR